MAEDREKDAPSLEPPSLFGRKRKKRAAPAPPEPEQAAPPLPEPVIPSAPEQVAPPVPVEVARPAVARDDSPTTIFDDTSEPTVVSAPAPVATATSPLSPPPAPPEEPRGPRKPWLPGRAAAAVTGLLVGGLVVAATSGSLRLCTEVKGTSSCGGPGFFLLLAILVVAVLLGTALLRAAQVPEPGSTSFLAVGLLSVVTLLFLVGSIFEWWMAVVIPLVSVAMFLVSHWVTTTYIDPSDDR